MKASYRGCTEALASLSRLNGVIWRVNNVISNRSVPQFLEPTSVRKAASGMSSSCHDQRRAKSIDSTDACSPSAV